MAPSAPSQLGRGSSVDFVLLELTNDIAEIHARDKVATPVLPLPTLTKPDYVVRRIECWKTGYVSEELLDVSTSLPLGLQAAFRRKLLLVLALQLLAVWIAVGLATFYPPVRDRVTPAFSPILLGFSAASTLVLLSVLYFQRNRRYINVLVLMWFSAAQAATFVGLGVTFDTHIGFFNCGATFTWVLLMILLAGVRVKNRHLMSPLVAGMLSFSVVVCASLALFEIYGEQFVTRAAFGYSLLFQFVLLTWFSWDAAWMFEVVAVDEFAYGVIYIYTDIVLSFLFSVAVVGVAVGFTSMMVLMLGGGSDCCELGINCCLVIVDSGPRTDRSRPATQRTRRDYQLERV
ncbi:hypothetical protein V7S43_018768 [Phytophthora oleae]|uniref:Uncharacterized protein n=1 Tax=Phytophthora oleae TaxID=2107226 RepID=A0ABD3ETR3_9STRA